MNQIAYVSSIQRYSVHDGPGIRTTVFFLGCPLRCRWCHNPECLEALPGLRYLEAKCIGCGSCAAACPTGALELGAGGLAYGAERCTRCLACARACPAGALTATGTAYTAQELAALLLEDLPFFQGSGGGVTFSGGEPALQSRFLCELIPRLRNESVHIGMETAGHVAWEHLERLAPLTDLFLYDVKALDPGLHREGTGVDNRLILENLRRLAAQGCQILIRTPVIPGFNDAESDMRALARLIREDLQSALQVELLPYHSLGGSKRAQLFQSVSASEYPPLPPGTMSRLARVLRSCGVPVKHGETEEA